MSRPSLAFVDHSFHKKTHSSDFLRELFKENFDVYDYWDEAWEGGSPVSAASINTHEYAFFLQVLPPLNELKKITIPMLWAPMYDGFKFDYWYMQALSCLPLKILSFSEKITHWAEQFSIPLFTTHYYYLTPDIQPSYVSGVHIFFWYRGDISFSDIRSLFNPSQIDSFTILEIPDAKGSKISLSDEDIRTYKINRKAASFLLRDEYLRLLNNSSVFIAPRKKEGIGAFTEALMLGKCVVAYDDAVHNEYIIDGVDGYLYDKSAKRLDLTKAQDIGEAARASAVAGYATWLHSRSEIVPFFKAAYTPHQTKVTFWVYTQLYTLTRHLRKIRYYIKYSATRIFSTV